MASDERTVSFCLATADNVLKLLGITAEGNMMMMSDSEVLKRSLAVTLSLWELSVGRL